MAKIANAFLQLSVATAAEKTPRFTVDAVIIND